MSSKKIKTEYLITGSGHAGLSAVEEIRSNDGKGRITMVTMEDTLPYSPTVLPYIISGKVNPDQIILRAPGFFKEKKINFLKRNAVRAIDPGKNVVVLSNGGEIQYDKVLLATGSEPTIPNVENLTEVPFLKLRIMSDALDHLKAMKQAKSIIVMGTGLVGMHAAENFVHKGMHVDVVRARAKKNPRVLPNYFDEECSRLIQGVFESKGVEFYLENYAVRVDHRKNKFIVALYDGQDLMADLLLVCIGVEPRKELVSDSKIEIDKGVLVNRKMKSSVDNVWAAGDVAQGDDFFGKEKILNAILPNAVLQGKIAGADMCGARLDCDYSGGISKNVFSYFGNRAFSVGINIPHDEEEYVIDKTCKPSKNFFQKTIFRKTVLVGMSAVNSNLDPGIVFNLIQRRINLKKKRAEFIHNTLNMSRRLMWSQWR